MAAVTIIMGSASDEEKVAPCTQVLKSLGIDFYLTVSSAHRTPKRTAEIVAEQEKLGTKVFICAAGMAAHLAGVVASQTLCPVIGVPVASGSLQGLDALFSTVQMPTGFPVATVAIGGAKNAAFLAAQILAINDVALREKLIQKRESMTIEVANIGDELAKKY